MAATILRMKALEALNGVGDVILGQFEEQTEVAYHIRRRLSVEEQAEIGDAVDIRGTGEAKQRLARCKAWLPLGWNE